MASGSRPPLCKCQRWWSWVTGGAQGPGRLQASGARAELLGFRTLGPAAACPDDPGGHRGVGTEVGQSCWMKM